MTQVCSGAGALRRRWVFLRPPQARGRPLRAGVWPPRGRGLQGLQVPRPGERPPSADPPAGSVPPWVAPGQSHCPEGLGARRGSRPFQGALGWDTWVWTEGQKAGSCGQEGQESPVGTHIHVHTGARTYTVHAFTCTSVHTHTIPSPSAPESHRPASATQSLGRAPPARGLALPGGGSTSEGPWTALRAEPSRGPGHLTGDPKWCLVGHGTERRPHPRRDSPASPDPGS